MYRRQLLRNALIILFGYLLAGCLASTPTKPGDEQVSLERVQMEDNDLTCSEISGQVSRLDLIIQEYHENAANKMLMQVPTAAGTQAATTTLAQFAPSSIPYLGSVVSSASQYYAQHQATEQNSAVKAQIRKDYLVSLYNQKNCLRPSTGNTLTRNAQGYLNQLGYSCGVADGIMGPKTQEAIRKYQADHGLQVDGNVSPTLVTSLKQAAAGNQ